MTTRSARHGWFPIRYLARRATAPWRRLPDFLLIGAQKSGTSSLFHALGRHPEIRRSTLKEPEYFTYNQHRGEGWYRSFFPFTWDDVVTGEATPYYLFSADSAAAARALIPNARLIVIMRNPVDRAYSQYNMLLNKEELPPFEDAVGLNGDDRHEVRRQFLGRGRYADHIENWLRHFPQEQFAFLKAEDFFARPQSVMKELHAFLGLSEVPAPSVKQLVAGKYKQPLAAETRSRLAEYFAEPNARLARLVGRDFGW